MDDLISRAEAIKSVCKMLSNCFNASEEMIESVKITVGEMPSAQQWIPCTPETMPPDYQWYYATCKSLVDNRENWVVEGCYTPWEHFDSTPMIKCGQAEVIAWMPKGFPEPLKGGKNMCGYKIFSKRLKEQLNKKGMTQKELAEKIGTTEVSVSRYVSGQRIPKASVVFKIATAIGVSTDYLLGVEEKDGDGNV